MDFELFRSVTIVVPSRKIDTLLNLCLRKTRDIYKNIPIIVVLDDISECNTLLGYGNVTVLHQAGTISKKRNKAVDIVKTQYTAFLDSDAYPQNFWLENIINFLEHNPAYGVAVPTQVNAEGDSFMQRCIRRLKLSPLATGKEIFCMFGAPNAQDTDLKFAPATGMIINNKCFLKVDGFNENRYIFEDYEFCQKMLSTGFKLRFIKNSVIFHRERPFWAYIKQRYCYIYLMVCYKDMSRKYSLAALVPFFITLMLCILLAFGFYKIVAAFIFIAFFFIVSESVRLAFSVKSFFAIIFIYISLYLTWILTDFLALMHIGPKPQMIYKHN